MFPFIEVWGQTYSTNAVLMMLLIGIALTVFTIAFRREKISFYKHIILVSIMTGIGLVGARLFYVLFVDTTLLRNPSLDTLFHFQGMVFYGSFLLGALCFPFVIKLLYLRSIRGTPYPCACGRKTSPCSASVKNRLWDLSSILMAFSYGVLRIGCLANGCCWGRINDQPCAVVYDNPQSLMPYLGIPVHPVQLYDSLGGFFMATVLAGFYRKGLCKGNLFVLLCLFYAVIRFVTEAFRGDAFRGEDVLGWLSMSQTLSVGLFAIGLFFLIRLYPPGLYRGLRS
ncbi:MAG: prolipoprotein diacylglyceryl transferase [Aestuariivita sp.]|nr:prolipoprotein diacylglyceryl transferase [Aestuariivita sp.]